MRIPGISILGLMAFVAMMAVDFAVMGAFRNVMEATTRIALSGALFSANVLAVALVRALSNLSAKGEVSLSLATFLLVGAVGTLVLIFVGILAPGLFYSYVDLVANPLQDLLLSARQRRDIAVGRSMPPLMAFGLGAVQLVGVIAIMATVALPVLLVAALAGWLVRGRRLRLEATE